MSARTTGHEDRPAAFCTLFGRSKRVKKKWAFRARRRCKVIVNLTSLMDWPLCMVQLRSPQRTRVRCSAFDIGFFHCVVANLDAPLAAGRKVLCIFIFDYVIVKFFL